MKKGENRRIKIVASVIAGVVVILFLVLGVFAKMGDFANLNREIYDLTAQLINPVLTNFMKVVSFLGEWYVWLILAGILTLIAKTRTDFGWPAVLATLVAGTGSTVLKDIFRISRPHVHWLIQEGGWGFPSGHAMIATAFVATVVYFLWRSKLAKKWKILATILGILWVFAIGFSRIYLGVHNPTDVLGGILAGSVVAALVVYLATVFKVTVREK